jgi:hypothetical protein
MRNETRKSVLATDADVADTSEKRRKGLPKCENWRPARVWFHGEYRGA